MSKILIVTDAWHPQTNGVVRCLEAVGRELTAQGDDVHFLTPDGFWTLPMPTYPEIRLSLTPPGAVSGLIARLRPDHIHIATEGPLGMMAALYCTANEVAFTTSYHTRFPEYVAARVPVPTEWSYGFLRMFHSAAAATLVPTASILDDLRDRGFNNLVQWSRGVDLERFRPGARTMFSDLPGPYFVYVGRVAVEKNIEAFLKTDLPGSKIIVGGGPQLEDLRARYPECHFPGHRSGAELTAAYQSADVFVFPSRTDTFGNVMLEALACGTPVAAYPVAGPVDVLTDPTCGALDEDLGIACLKALMMSPGAARRFAEKFRWGDCASTFRRTLVPTRKTAPLAA